MKLSQWAKQQGISYHTAWRWFNEGHLPVKAFKTKTNTILVKSPVVKENGKMMNAAERGERLEQQRREVRG